MTRPNGERYVGQIGNEYVTYDLFSGAIGTEDIVQRE